MLSMCMDGVQLVYIYIRALILLQVEEQLKCIQQWENIL